MKKIFMNMILVIMIANFTKVKAQSEIGQKSEYIPVYKLPDTLSDNQLLEATAFSKIVIYFPSEQNKKYFAIVSENKGWIKESSLYQEVDNNWVKINIPVKNPYGIKNVCGILEQNEKIWIEVKSFEGKREINKAFIYDLYTNEFEPVSR